MLYEPEIRADVSVRNAVVIVLIAPVSALKLEKATGAAGTGIRVAGSHVNSKQSDPCWEAAPACIR